MKLFHLSDLHIGKQLHYYNLKDNQIEILNQIIDKAKEYRPDAIIIAGDIYDKSVPSAEAVTIFDQFLIGLSEITPSIPILIIAGNHDSAERLNYASSFLERYHIYISTMPPQSPEEFLKKVVLRDEFGEVNFYLLPFVKPGYVRHLFEDGVVTSYDTAVASLIEREAVDYSQRNVLVSHQFYVAGDTTPETCESEQVYISVGGIDNVDIVEVKQFDYVALGHLHGAQQISEDYIRYSGTPLKYSTSEEKHRKSITMVTLSTKEEKPLIEQIPLVSSQDVRKEKGTLAEIIERATDLNRHDFLSITLTDEENLFKPKDQLEEYYDHIIEIKVENSRTRAQIENTSGEVTALNPLDSFREFYQEMQCVPMIEEEEKIMIDVINSVKGAE
jgi:exonuclease SbcD